MELTMYRLQKLQGDISRIATLRLKTFGYVPFLRSWGNIRHSPLIHLSHPRRLNLLSILFIRSICVLLQSGKGEPSIVIRPIERKLFFILYPAFPQYCKLDSGTISIYARSASACVV